MPNCLEGDLGDCGDRCEGGKLGGCSKLPLGRRVGNIITNTNANMPLDLFCPLLPFPFLLFLFIIVFDIFPGLMMPVPTFLSD